MLDLFYSKTKLELFYSKTLARQSSIYSILKQPLFSKVRKASGTGDDETDFRSPPLEYVNDGAGTSAWPSSLTKFTSVGASTLAKVSR